MPGGAPGGTSSAMPVAAWTPGLKAEYRAFIVTKKTLSDNSIHSYCWRVENLIKAVANGKEDVVLPLRNKQELKQLIETNLNEAKALVKQDDRQSHFDLLKRMLDIVDARVPLAALEEGERAKPEGGGGGRGAGSRDKVWDPEVRQNYRIWLRSRGIKDRTCGSYCTYVHSLLRVLLDKDNSQRAAADTAALMGPPVLPPLLSSEQQPGGGAVARAGPLGLEALKQLMVTHADEANAQVKKSKKTRYLRSFREFLGLAKPSTARKRPRVWSDRFGAEYKQWLARNGMVENGRARAKGYLGAARTMLRLVRKMGWAAGSAEEGGVGVTRQAVATAIDTHRSELGELCDKADGERVGALLEYLQASEEEVSKLLADFPIVDENESDDNKDGEEEEEEDEDEDEEAERDERTISTAETGSAGGSASMEQASMPGASVEKAKGGKSKKQDAGSGQVKKLQKRVRELEGQYAEKQRECDALHLKVARLEHELQRLRAPAATQIGDLGLPPTTLEGPAGAILQPASEEQAEAVCVSATHGHTSYEAVASRMAAPDQQHQQEGLQPESATMEEAIQVALQPGGVDSAATQEVQVRL